MNSQTALDDADDFYVEMITKDAARRDIWVQDFLAECRRAGLPANIPHAVSLVNGGHLTVRQAVIYYAGFIGASKIAAFEDESEADAMAYLFPENEWIRCCAGGYQNAFEARARECKSEDSA